MINLQVQKDLEELFDVDDSWIQKLNDHSILITGSTGLIGSILCKAILYYDTVMGGHIKLICHARNKDKAEIIFSDYIDSPYLEFCYGDINDGLFWTDNVDYLIHCANTTSSWAYVNKPVETIRTIVNGTDNILRFAISHDVRSLVYLSSMETYGAPNWNGRRTSEDEAGYIDTMNVRSSYSEGKRLAECLCASYFSEYNLNVKVARLAQVFGAGVGKNDKRVFMQLALSAMSHENFIMRSDGSSSGNYCYTTDAVKALIMLLTLGKAGEAYNIVNEENSVTIKEMAEMVSHEIAGDSFKIVYDIPESNLTYGYAPKVDLKLSSKKINNIGWSATISLKEMYRRLINGLD